MVSGHPGDVSNSGEFSSFPENYLSQSVLPFPLSFLLPVPWRAFFLCPWGHVQVNLLLQLNTVYLLVEELSSFLSSSHSLGV